MDKQDRHIRIRLLVGPQDMASSKMHMQWDSYSCVCEVFFLYRPNVNVRLTGFCNVDFT